MKTGIDGIIDKVHDIRARAARRTPTADGGSLYLITSLCDVAASLAVELRTLRGDVGYVARRQSAVENGMDPDC